MKRFILLICLFSVLPRLSGQNSLLNDTLAIGEVVIHPKKPDGESGFRKLIIETKDIKSSNGTSLSDLLETLSPLYLKNYGGDGLSSLSIRGMGANHTNLMWEGIKIDNPMLGQSDFSVIPSMFIDNLSIFYGGNPKIFGNRGPGGTIDINTQPRWEQGTSIQLAQKIASWMDIFEGLEVNSGSGNFEYRSKAYLHYSKNNYKYLDDTSGEEIISRRENAGFQSRGILQEVYYKAGSNILSAKIWYSSVDRQVPGSLLTYQTDNNENQYDESLRTLLSLNSYKGPLKFTSQLTFVSNWLNYTNHLLDIDSRNLIKSFSGSLSACYSYNEGSSIVLGVQAQKDNVSTNNYASDISRIIYTVDLTYSQLISNRLGIFATLSQQLADNVFLPISPSFGLDLRLLDYGDVHLKSSIGKSNYLPGLNDLYWLPGGNPDLNPEDSFNSEISLSSKSIIGKTIAETSITAYNSNIKDMILWQPVSPAVWSPVNIAEVHSRGLEFDQSFTLLYGMHRFYLDFAYSYNSVIRLNAISDNDEAQGKQIIYVPKSLATLLARYDISNIQIYWKSAFTDARYITSDNTESLPLYFDHTASISSNIKLRQSDLILSLSVNNIFNSNYQNVMNYPMPRRSFQLSLKLKIGKHD